MENKESIKLKGIHTISVCKATSDDAHFLEQKLDEFRLKRGFLMQYGLNTFERMKALWDEYNYYLGLLHKKYLVNQVVVENITCTVGRTVIAQRISGTNTYTLNVAYTALGSSSAAPAVGNTTLGTEVYRKALSSGTNSTTTALVETFFTATETSGTYEEFAMFIDGTAAANSGQLLNRFTTSITKAVTETLNVQSSLAVADA